MTVMTPSFLLGLALLGYLSTFILFAIIRIVTGVAIQRVGLSGLRRIAFTPREGLRIDIRGLGLSVHRPTLAQPTWISIRLSELKLTVDLTLLGRARLHRPRARGWQAWRKSRSDGDPDASSRTKFGERLARLREKIKTVNRQIFWLRMFDLVATNTAIEVREVGVVQLASFTLALDTRLKKGPAVARGEKKRAQPAEWIGTWRGLYLIPEGGEGTELLDNGTLNLSGTLQTAEGRGMKDAAIAIKLGRVNVPVDDVKEMAERVKKARQTVRGSEDVMSETEDMSASGAEPETEALVTEPEMAEERWESRTSTPSAATGGDDSNSDRAAKSQEWPELVRSMLASVLEVQFAVSSAAFSKVVRTPGVGSGRINTTVSMKELGIDLLRLESDSPTHLTYFSRSDIAHQALIAAISISLGVDRGKGEIEQVLSIPMMTATVRTTLLTKFVEFLSQNHRLNGLGFADPAMTSLESILVASLVMTSPSLDLDPRHVPLLLSLMKIASSRGRRHHSYSRSFYTRSSLGGGNQQKRHWLVSKLLPRASVRTSVHEPVIRVVLPAAGSDPPSEAFDLLIGTMTSVGFDFDSSHSQTQSSHYAANGVFRVSAAQLYYQTHGGEKHSMLVADSLDVKTHINASNTVAVAASATLQNCGVHLVRPEIGRGIRQIVMELATGRARGGPIREKESFLRGLPAWLVSAHVQCIDLSIEVAGLDPVVSTKSKGLALHVEHWNAEYQNENRTEDAPARLNRRRGSSRVISPDDFLRVSAMNSPTSPRRQMTGFFSGSATDGRRLVLGIGRLSVYVITGDGDDGWDPAPLVSVPQAEMVIETKTDKDRPLCAVSATAQAVFIRYSLFRHYAIVVALSVVKETFARDLKKNSDEASDKGGSGLDTHLMPLAAMNLPRHSDANQVFTIPSPLLAFSAPVTGRLHPRGEGWRAPEVFALGFLARFVQVKIDGPTGAPVLIQIRDLEGERRPWSSPTVRVRSLRLCVPTPQLPTTWSRVIDIQAGQVDFRSHRELGQDVQRAIDVSTDRVRVCVPDQMVVYLLIDNLVTLGKTVKELPGRVASTGWPDERGQTARPVEKVPMKDPQPPLKLPAITVRTKTLLVEVEDAPFEWKLGLIYRVGLAEQTQRLAREAAFKYKAIWARNPSGPSGAGRRARSAQRDRTKAAAKPKRSSSVRADSREGIPSESRGRKGERMDGLQTGKFFPRYAPDEPVGLSDSVERENWDAWYALQRYNHHSWVMRINQAIAEARQASREADDPDPAPEFAEQAEEQVLSTPRRAALLSIRACDFLLEIRKPSFGVDGWPTFINKMGKGMPTDMKYSLLVPMGVRIMVDRLQASLRDYPLKMLDVPTGGLELVTDFVIAEEYRDHESIRWVKVNVVPSMKPETLGCAMATAALPKEQATSELDRGLTVIVPRTVAPLKSYSNMAINILSPGSTKLAWANSYQSAIQDLMQVVEGFTKPPIDTSERMGFWDKIRLTFHSRMQIKWPNGGDLQLVLKGSRDPYDVLGAGAGFVFCWQDQVCWRIGDGRPEEFMVIDSGIFLLAVPDFGLEAERDKLGVLISGSNARSSDSADSDSVSDSTSSDTLFSKTVMKLTGKVRWQAGLVFEREAGIGGKRSFTFAPHYSVVLKDPSHIRAGHDAYAGFRSSFIHMSVAISATAPTDQEREGPPLEGGDENRVKKPAVAGYNSIHLSPHLLSHFFSWWSLFSGVMSIPIRQGKIWPGPARSSKKFGRHLETIKYSLLLEPVYLAHIYRHADVAEPSNLAYSGATGLKGRVDHFEMEMHQRRERLKVNPNVRGKRRKQATAMKIHRARVDCVSADLRAVEARMYEPELDILPDGTRPTGAAAPAGADGAGDRAGVQMPPGGAGKVTVADKDMTWIDMDDFRELDWTAAREINVMTNVLGLMYAPRVTYFRETDLSADHAGSVGRTAFGGEEASDPRRVQAGLIGERLKELDEQIKRTDRKIGEVKLRLLLMEITEPESAAEIARLEDHKAGLGGKVQFLKRMRVVLLEEVGEWALAMEEARGLTGPEVLDRADFSAADDDATLADFVSDFENRFIVHNGQLKWNNSLRNIILRYSHQVSQRRGLVYYASRRAVQFLLDVVKEQRARRERERDRLRKRKDESEEAAVTTSKAKTGGSKKPKSSATTLTEREALEIELDEHLEGAEAAMQNFVDEGTDGSARTSTEADGSVMNVPVDDTEIERSAVELERTTPTEAVRGGKTDAASQKAQAKRPHELTALKSYHARLIAPQIQLQSERNPSAAVLATATNMQLKVMQIMETARVLDDVSGLIQRKYSATMDRVQIFVTDEALWEADNDGTGRVNFAALAHGTGAGGGSGSGGTASPNGRAGRKRSGKKSLGPSASRMWPPWVPMEVMFEFSGDPIGFMRVIQRTNANMRYDKYNTLRVGSNGNGAAGGAAGSASSGPHGSPTNRIWIGFPHLRATCDSAQYYAVYLIVLDLLLYAEPLEQDQKTKLDKILIATDFSDLSGVPARVGLLQERLRQLELIRSSFLLRARISNGPGLGVEGWQSLRRVEADLTQVRDELFFTIKAVAASQRRKDKDRGAVSASGGGVANTSGGPLPPPPVASDPAEEQLQLDDATGLRHWTIEAAEIEWALIRGQAGQEREPLVRLRLRDARYDRVDQADGSNRNVIGVGMIEGENLLPGAVYRQMVSAYGRPSCSSPSESVVGGGASVTGNGHLAPRPLGSGAMHSSFLSTASGASGTIVSPPPSLSPAPAPVIGEKMVRVEWYVLEAIGGIQIIYQFEARIVPLKLQLEREVGVKLFEYIFPAVGDAGEGSEVTAGAKDKDGQTIGPIGEEPDEDDSDGESGSGSDWSHLGGHGGGAGADNRSGSHLASSLAGRLLPTLGAGRLARLGNRAVDRAVTLVSSPSGGDNTGGSTALARSGSGDASSAHGRGGADKFGDAVSANGLAQAPPSSFSPGKGGKLVSTVSDSPPRRKFGAIRSFTFGDLLSRSGNGNGSANGAGVDKAAGGDGGPAGSGGAGGDDSRSIKSRMSGRSRMKGSFFGDDADTFAARPATDKSSDGRSRLRYRRAKGGASSSALTGGPGADGATASLANANASSDGHSRFASVPFASSAPQDDELSQMLRRAAQYRILAAVRIQAMTLCVSYKGKGQRNWEDVHDLVVRMPTLEYRNKIWSNYDLAMQVRREVRNVLISHAGAIIGNKFRRHDDGVSTGGTSAGLVSGVANVRSGLGVPTGSTESNLGGLKVPVRVAGSSRSRSRSHSQLQLPMQPSSQPPLMSQPMSQSMSQPSQLSQLQPQPQPPPQNHNPSLRPDSDFSLSASIKSGVAGVTAALHRKRPGSSHGSSHADGSVHGSSRNSAAAAPFSFPAPKDRPRSSRGVVAAGLETLGLGHLSGHERERDRDRVEAFQSMSPETAPETNSQSSDNGNLGAGHDDVADEADRPTPSGPVASPDSTNVSSARDQTQSRGEAQSQLQLQPQSHTPGHGYGYEQGIASEPRLGRELFARPTSSASVSSSSISAVRRGSVPLGSSHAPSAMASAAASASRPVSLRPETPGSTSSSSGLSRWAKLSQGLGMSTSGGGSGGGGRGGGGIDNSDSTGGLGKHGTSAHLYSVGPSSAHSRRRSGDVSSTSKTATALGALALGLGRMGRRSGGHGSSASGNGGASENTTWSPGNAPLSGGSAGTGSSVPSSVISPTTTASRTSTSTQSTASIPTPTSASSTSLGTEILLHLPPASATPNRPRESRRVVVPSGGGVSTGATRNPPTSPTTPMVLSPKVLVSTDPTAVGLSPGATPGVAGVGSRIPRLVSGPIGKGAPGPGLNSAGLDGGFASGARPRQGSISSEIQEGTSGAVQEVSSTTSHIQGYHHFQQHPPQQTPQPQQPHPQMLDRSPHPQIHVPPAGDKENELRG